MRFPAVPKSVLSVSKAALVCAVSLGFAAAIPAAFAQRGGGGSHGGGGGHVSGGGRAASGSYGGSARSYSGSAGRSSGASSGRYGSSAPVYASGSSNRGYTRNFWVPGPASRGASSSFAGAGEASPVIARSFAGNNYYWQEPPQQGRPIPAVRPISVPPMRPISFPGANPAMNTRPFTPLPGMVIHQPFSWSRAFNAAPRFRQTPVSTLRHPVATGSPFIGMTSTAFAPGFNSLGRPCFGIGNPCFGFGQPFFNPFFFSGFGFGFGGGCFSGGFLNSCGFAPFGLGLYDMDWGLGYDYGDGYFYPTGEEPPPPPENPTEDNPPPNYAPGYYFLPPPDEAVAAASAETQPLVKLELKDGTIFDVYSYWLQDDRLNYITTYNIQTSIPVEDLDLQKTVDLNEKLGVTFTLSNKPPDQQQPPDSQQPPPQNQ
jgi:hypothetical protein